MDGLDGRREERGGRESRREREREKKKQQNEAGISEVGETDGGAEGQE